MKDWHRFVVIGVAVFVASMDERLAAAFLLLGFEVGVAVGRYKETASCPK